MGKGNFLSKDKEAVKCIGNRGRCSVATAPCIYVYLGGKIWIKLVQEMGLHLGMLVKAFLGFAEVFGLYYIHDII